MPYLDTSILGSYYCAESFSASVNAALIDMVDPIISWLVEIEFYSLISLKVRMGSLVRADTRKVLAKFQSHLADGFYQFVDIGIRERAQARQWLERCDTPLRTVDALHLSAAFSHGQEILTTDKGLHQSARALGVKCRFIE